ncbi:MAG: ribonuclease D [Pikeienuella sp.]
MELITTQDALATACEAFAQAPYVTIDTEFMRERTYWPKLCLVQLSRPTGVWGDELSVIIDPLAAIDLQPLFDLMANEAVLKVFHAARQDVEIFVNLTGAVPKPLFDSQVAAMVCGYGDQVGYETLVRRIAKAQLDKSSRFTDWARRPLSEKQLNYAIGDVTYLRDIYEELRSQLKKTGRESWVAAEMDVLNRIETYVVDPEMAWKRLKTRSNDPRFLGAVRSLARWREQTAKDRDVPRGRILKDDAILEIAAAKPKTKDALLSTRSLQKEGRKAETCIEILAALEEGLANPVEIARPQEKRPQLKPGALALIDLLKVLLKAKAEDLGVAQRLIASASDLEGLVTAQSEEDLASAPVLNGWRRDAFGNDALRLMRGEVALSTGRNGVVMVELPPE